MFNAVAQKVVSGDVQIMSEASVEVRRSSDNALVSLFSDAAGASPLGNPYTTGTDGQITFYTESEKVGVTASKDGDTITWPDVLIGQDSRFSDYDEGSTETTVSDALDARVPSVATLAALKTVAATGFSGGEQRYVKGRATAQDGYQGRFTWLVGDYSTQVAADTTSAIYVEATDVAATVGAWKRDYVGAVFASWFDQTKAGAIAAIAYAKSVSPVTLKFTGAWSLPVGAQSVSDFGVSLGDPVFDIPSLYAVMVSEADGLTIDAEDATFETDTASVFCLYKCKNTRASGGSFTRTGSDAAIDSNQSSAIIITRSYKTEWSDATADGFYRAFFSYRSIRSGFEYCDSQNDRYWGLYSSSELDVAIPGVFSTHRQYIRNCSSYGGRYGSIFADNTDVFDCDCVDAAPDGNTAAHVTLQDSGNVSFTKVRVSESRNSNSGDVVNGFSIAPTASFPSPLSNVDITDCSVSGTRLAYFLTGLDKFKLKGNTAVDYWQTGIALLTLNDGSQDRTLRNGVVNGNAVYNRNDSSTLTAVGNEKNAGLQIEENDGVAIGNVELDGNMVDAKGDNSSSSQDYNVYVEIAATTDRLAIGTNNFDSPLTNLITGYRDKTERRVSVAAPITSSGSTASPTALPYETVSQQVIQIFDSSVALPAAKSGMKVTFIGDSSTCNFYVDGASTGVAGSDTMYCPGVAATSIGLSFSAPFQLTFVCTTDTLWSVNPGPNTPTVLT